LDYLRLSLIFLLLTSTARADWYILLPKGKKPPASRPQVKKPPLPKLKTDEVKPYTVEVRKILAPSFSVATPELKRIGREELLGKTVILLFVDNLFSPETERLVKEFESSGMEGVVFIVVDVDDSDFASAKSFKELLGLKRVIVTADSYVYRQFKERVGELSLPSIVVIDRHGFIRFFSPRVSPKRADVVKSELAQIVKELERAQSG